MIKWKKRIMMMLVVCIMATMPSAIAEAQVFNLKSTPTDYYSYHDIKDYMVINKSRMYYHLLNDKPVFCVESGIQPAYPGSSGRAPAGSSPARDEALPGFPV